VSDYSPITPPPELVQQWVAEIWHEGTPVRVSLSDEHIAARAAQWGADQELEACVEWLGDAPVVYNDNGDLHPGSYLRDARRPKPPSLKQQALNALQKIEDNDINATYLDSSIIRLALETLDD
jgi:hypothetical protein